MKEVVLRDITKGNEQAAAFIIAYLQFCHLMDDIIDEPEKVDDRRLVREQLGFLEQVIINPWVKDNIGLLWGHIVTGASAWIDSNRWSRSGTDKQKTSVDTLKGQYHETIWFVAYLCGGLEHQQEITTRYRDYDYEQQ